MNTLNSMAILAIAIVCQYQASGQWIQFTDSTESRLVISAPFIDDKEEKDITQGDFDQNGWMDLVVVRKSPFGVAGPAPDMLLLNTNGILEDKTTSFAPDFLTRFSDARDVFSGDLDGDGWIDLVVANTFEDQPILYHNRGRDAQGNWLGFADSSSVRFPMINLNPLQFCAVWGGDITGNGHLDLYFSNYAFFGGSEDLLLINDGTGHFTDETVSRLDSLRFSAFGTSVEITDMDNDGDQDIIKISASYEMEPWNSRGVFLLFNDGSGHFVEWCPVTDTTAAAYMFTVHDFDDDGGPDVYVVDDGQDYVRRATNIFPDSLIIYESIAIPDLRTIGFGGNCKLADLDFDGDLDLGICDVDISIPPCESQLDYRRFSMMANQAGTLAAPYGLGDSLWNVSAFDFEFIDIDNNGTQDIFMGLCTGYSLLMNPGLFKPCDSFSSSTAYVDSSSNGTGDGSTWENAFTELQQAIYAAENCDFLDTIMVASGTYFPSTTGIREVHFSLPDQLTILGGFPPGGSLMHERDPTLFSTILSGDIGQLVDSSDNSFTVIEVNQGDSCTLDGFTITGGNSIQAMHPEVAAGLTCAGHITLKNVHFSNNTCPANGYVFRSTGSLTIENCVISLGQGSIYIAQGSEATVKGVSSIE